MARIEQSDLAMAAKVSVDTIKRLERTIGPVSANVVTVSAVLQVLEAAGIEFTNGNQPGVRTKKATIAGALFKPGDRIKYREDRPADPQKIGMVGTILDRIPLMGNQVWVEFPDGTIYSVDKGALVHATD
jgi:hypothetical protein